MARTDRQPPIASAAVNLGTPGPIREQIPYGSMMRGIVDSDFRGIVAYIWAEYTAAGKYLKENV